MNAARLLRASRPRCIGIGLLACLSLALLLHALGQIRPIHAADHAATEAGEVTVATDPDTRRFRRAFVPAGRVNEWPRGNDRYLPMDVAEFEREFSAWVGVRYSVFVNSGASANLITMAALKIRCTESGLEPGGEVIVPTLTWTSDIVSVLQFS